MQNFFSILSTNLRKNEAQNKGFHPYALCPTCTVLEYSDFKRVKAQSLHSPMKYTAVTVNTVVHRAPFLNPKIVVQNATLYRSEFLDEAGEVEKADRFVKRKKLEKEAAEIEEKIEIARKDENVVEMEILIKSITG